ncbi:MAG: hypothetical protein WDM90_04890 [Ferruginibacter sp.]
MNAKKAQDPSIIRNVKVACAQACPSDCITFGNVMDTESDIYKSRQDKNRTFYVMETIARIA